MLKEKINRNDKNSTYGQYLRQVLEYFTVSTGVLYSKVLEYLTESTEAILVFPVADLQFYDYNLYYLQ